MTKFKRKSQDTNIYQLYLSLEFIEVKKSGTTASYHKHVHIPNQKNTYIWKFVLETLYLYYQRHHLFQTVQCRSKSVKTGHME